MAHARALLANGVGLEAGSNPGWREALAAQLGPLADEAVEIVETYAAGMRARLAPMAAPLPEPPEFLPRLAIILNGLAPHALAATNARPAPAPAPVPQIIQSELWQLLYKVRESAELSYSRETDLVELDRRLLMLLRNFGALVPAELAGALGVDKAQVSRSVKRLLGRRLVDRSHIRAPLALTRKGAALADRLNKLAELRNRELSFDISDDDLAEFFRVIDILLRRAVSLYEIERARNGSDAASVNPFRIDPDQTPGTPLVIDRSRLVSPLMTLSAYFSRSGALTFKRLTGLSNFEVWVLNEIGLDSPLEWNQLVARLDRDHSQAGRTVRALLERGLITREGRPGRRHGRFAPTRQGQHLFDIIQEASRQRSAFLLAPLSPAERERFLATFALIRRNATLQLERERTFDQLESQ